MSKSKQVTATKKIVKRRGLAAGSMSDQINKLEVGQSISLSERFPIGSHTAGGDDIKDAMNSMRGTLGTYLSRVRADDDLDLREFRTASGAFVTDDKTAIIACVVLSRTE